MDAGYRPDHAIRKCKYAVSCIGEQIHGVVVLPFLNEAIPRSCPQVRVSRILRMAAKPEKPEACWKIAMIPEGISREHILGAMERIDREGVPPGRDGWKFEVRHEGRVYPPKLLISLACEAAFGRPLPSGAFSGGAETNNVLQQLGFAVALKEGDAVPTSPSPARATTSRKPPPSQVVARSPEEFEALKRQLLSGHLYTWNELELVPHLPPPTAGVYAWFFKTIPPGVPTDSCSTRNGMALLYVGISPGRRGSQETLQSRLHFHFRGHAEGSTLRLTLGCLLENQLGTVLRRSGSRLIFGQAEKRLSQWMADNTAVTWVEVATPRPLEEYLLSILDLPLNIEGNRNHPFCEKLRALRDKARRRAEKLPNLKPR